MTGILLLDWPMMALSLFNTIVIAWMGLTVLLNAERRTWGVWFTGVGMLAGALFFISHSALLGLDLNDINPNVDVWWQIGWPIVSLLPLSWYVVMLWYSGFWDDRNSPLRRRHQKWLFVSISLSGLLTIALLIANPLPTYLQAATYALSDPGVLHGLPVLFVIYVLNNMLCISLSLDALLNPTASGRLMGNLARLRARPWLMTAALCMLLVSLLLALVLLWVVAGASNSVGITLRVIAAFDIILSSIIALAVLSIGRALVVYEVFTGKTLPRRGLYRQWRNAVILGAGFGVVAAGSLTLHAQPVYIVLLATVIITVFYALHNWRGYAEREQMMSQLRPFIIGQGLYDQLRAPRSADKSDATEPFNTLCRDVLGARLAYLIPLGQLAPLVGAGLAYPLGNVPAMLALNEITAQFGLPAVICVPLDPLRYAGASWAAPLWSEQGLIGILLLGEKRDGGLYAQEEIEVARAGGERLLDMQAGAAMARRLMALQRQRLAETQLLDQRARRSLHDDVLPRLHAAILGLSGAPNTDESVTLLADAHRRIAGLLHEMAATDAPEVAKDGVVGALRHVVEMELVRDFDAVTWNVEPQVESALRQLPQMTAEVVFYAAREALRNAARYGRGDHLERELRLHVSVTTAASNPQIIIEDDGVGLHGEARAQSYGGGSGQGLALHSTMMAVIGGSLAVDSSVGAGTQVVLILPTM